MKFSVPAFIVFSASCVAAAAADVEMRDAVRHEDLAKIAGQLQENDPMAKLAPSEGDDPAKVNQPGNLIDQSDLLCFGGFATLVPKRAILHVPESLKDRLQIQPDARILGWAEFYERNRGWLTTVEVSRVQAEGNEPLAEETSDRVSKSLGIVVATYQNGPISVLPMKEPTAGEPNPTKQ